MYKELQKPNKQKILTSIEQITHFKKYGTKLSVKPLKGEIQWLKMFNNEVQEMFNILHHQEMQRKCKLKLLSVSILHLSE